MNLIYIISNLCKSFKERNFYLISISPIGKFLLRVQTILTELNIKILKLKNQFELLRAKYEFIIVTGVLYESCKCLNAKNK